MMYYNVENKETKELCYMNYKEARSYIDEAQRFGGEISLAAITEFLEELGNPQDDLKFIHIAGTNGKGSVGAYLESVLREAGYRVGRFISPTLYEYRERIQINGIYISEEDFAETMELLVGVLQERKERRKPLPSPFEIETALSFLYFRKNACDFVLLECGMGGKMDATNVIRTTELAVITSISMDHMEYLGDTIGEIAQQKAGIIKPGADVVTCQQQPQAAAAIEKACRAHHNHLTVGRADQAEVLSFDLEHMTFAYSGKTITIHLAGAHQLENAVLALTAVFALIHRGYAIGDEQIVLGFEHAVWNGRFTILCREPYFIVDGAHNPDAALKLKKSIEMYFKDKNLIFLIGVFRDKQYEEICKILTPMAKEVVVMETPHHPRALPVDILADTVQKYNKRVHKTYSLADAVKQGFLLADSEDVVIAFGSLSFTGELTALVENRKNEKTKIKE